jgi:signal transduction histidine kinase
VTGLLHRARHPHTTVRWRLTLLYGGLFLVCGAALLAVTYTLVSHASVTAPRAVFARPPLGAPGIQIPGGAGFAIRSKRGVRALSFGGPVAVGPGGASPVIPLKLQRFFRSRAGRTAVDYVGNQQRVADLHQLEEESAIALAIMALISGVLGWLVAGRVLRPLRTITATAQEISEANLHRRLAMPGPRDELRQLADTIDGLLGRLEGAFEAQRRFVANASHELRTPLTAVRALLEMVLSDPEASVATFREACEEVLEESAHQERLIDALLTLAQGQRGIAYPRTIELDSVARQVADSLATEAIVRGVAIESSLEPAAVSGEERLIERLVANLLQNALRHNVPGGWVKLSVDTEQGRAVLRLTNSGPRVSPEELPRLLQPFQRLGQDRVAQPDGVGLGLSIVAAIAEAHGATLDLAPGQAGGLDVDVRFPTVPPDLVEPAVADVVLPDAGKTG